MQIYLLTFQLLVFVVYITYIYRKFGVLTSISESYYKLEPSGKTGLFTLFCFLLGFPMFAYMTTAPWAFFLSMTLSFTGVAGDFKRPTTDVIHFIGAVLGIAGAVIGISIQFWSVYWYAFILGLLVSMIMLRPTRNLVWFIEVYSFIAIIVTLYIVYL